MERIMRMAVFVGVFALLCLGSVLAEEKKPTFGVGFQATFPAWGLSEIVDLDKKGLLL